MVITDIKIHQPVGLLRLITDMEVEGWCLGVDTNSGRQIQALYRRLLVGESALDRERLWQAMVDAERPTARHPVHVARAYVDVALWDLVGKWLGLPVFRAIGGFRERLPAAKNGRPQEQIVGVIDDALQAQEEGFVAYNVAYTGGVPGAIEMARRVREAVGDDFYLMYDGRQGYVQTEAVRLGRVLQEADYHWFEEPLPGADLLGLQKLAAALDIPILGGAQAAALRATSQMVAVQAVDMVKAGVPRCGGITDVVKIARLAEAFGLHCELEADGRMGGFVHAHLMGAIKNSYFFATQCTGPQGGEPIVRNPLQVKGGYVSVPQDAGLGMQLDWPEVERGTEQII
jgi:L-alanine-DL-glutamate epimerase-like enolase superfamily enzyme